MMSSEALIVGKVFSYERQEKELLNFIDEFLYKII